jgi:hypothetical protein
MSAPAACVVVLGDVFNFSMLDHANGSSNCRAWLTGL